MVRTLIENPNRYTNRKAPTSETGIVTAGISVERKLRRNRKITSTTRMSASTRVSYTESIEASTNSDVSTASHICMPSGRPALSRGTIALTARATSSVLAVDCLTTPSANPPVPFTRMILRFS